MSISKGIPIQERTEADVREALKGQEKDVVESFLKLHAYAKEHHLGLSKLAARSDISQSSLSQSFNGDYEDKGGNVVETATRIDTFFWKLEQKAVHDAQKKFVNTRVANLLTRYYEKTRRGRRIQPIESPAQVGKTRSAIQYTADNNSGRTRYFEFTKSIGSLNDLIHAMAESFGVARGANLRDKKAALKDKIDSCDEIILDEAHLIFKLSQKECCKILDFIRTDLFQNGERGIVLLITHDREVGWFMDGLRRMAKEYRYNIDQLLGRMMIDVVRIDPGDYITEDDVALLLGRLYKPGKVILRELTALARTENSGHLGMVDYIMGEAWNRTKARGKDCSDEVVASILSDVKKTLDKNAKMGLYDK